MDNWEYLRVFWAILKYLGYFQIILSIYEYFQVFYDISDILIVFYGTFYHLGKYWDILGIIKVLWATFVYYLETSDCPMPSNGGQPQLDFPSGLNNTSRNLRIS